MSFMVPLLNFSEMRPGKYVTKLLRFPVSADAIPRIPPTSLSPGKTGDLDTGK